MPFNKPARRRIGIHCGRRAQGDNSFMEKLIKFRSSFCAIRTITNIYFVCKSREHTNTRTRAHVSTHSTIKLHPLTSL